MANGPRVFWCKVIEPIGRNHNVYSGEIKISAKGPKSAAETFVRWEAPHLATHYKPGVVKISVREDDVIRLFKITTSITAVELKKGR